MAIGDAFQPATAPADPDELRYRSLFVQSAIGLVELDSRGRVRRVNRRFCELAAPSVLDLHRRPFVELLPAGEWKECDLAIRQILAAAIDEDDRTFTFRFRSLLERHVDVQLTLCGLRTKEGRTTGVLVIVHDVTELENHRRHLERELARERDRQRRHIVESRKLLSEVVDAECRARERLAQNLHGAIQQQILAAMLHLPTTTTGAAAALRTVRELLREALDLTRSLSHDLRPEILAQRGLVAGLEWLADDVRRKHGLTLHLELDPRAEPQHDAARFVLFEVVRELLLNVVKHARAGHAGLRLALENDHEGNGDANGEATIRLVLRDDGDGFDSDGLFEGDGEANCGYGLRDVRHRIVALGGTIQLDSSPGEGTNVTIRAPLVLQRKDRWGHRDGADEGSELAALRLEPPPDRRARISADAMPGTEQPTEDSSPRSSPDPGEEPL